MASIIKRKNTYSVVYSYTDENGSTRQKWETFGTNAEAKRRKTQVEYEQSNGTFTVPTAKTVSELLSEYMAIYGVNTWAMSTYEGKQGLVRNYINPMIGEVAISDVTTHMVDKIYRELMKMKPHNSKFHKAKTETVTPHTVHEIHKLLRSAFNQAVKWELVSKNAFVNATLPKEEHQHREIWTAEELFRAVEVCDDDMLALAILLAFTCTLRMGELLGLTWDCVDLDPARIAAGKASIDINKELQRVNREALANLGEKGVIKKFPACIGNTHTALLLKEPKTKTSVRRVYLPKSVAEMLVKRKKEIDELKALFGNEFIDNNLVFCTSNGRAVESAIINRGFAKLIRDNNLPKVVFHSLRHSSITYKLKLNGGDIKSVQGDSGHAQAKMVSDVYSHIIDEDRCTNAQLFEEAFFRGRETSATQAETPAKLVSSASEETNAPDLAQLIELLKNPEAAALLKTLAKAI